jgi:putative sterol carrier protein
LTDLTVREMVFGHEQAFLPEKAAGVDAVIQYCLTGEESGDFIITIRDGKCTVQEGKAQAARLTLTADGTELRDIFLGKVDGMMAFMQGKLKLAGDMNLAMRLTSLFKMQ